MKLHEPASRREGLSGLCALSAALLTLILTAVAPVVAQPAPAGSPTATTRTRKKRPVKRPAKLDGYVIVSGYHDDNVFSYSDSDRTIYENSATPLERFPIDQISDFVTDVAARGDVEWSRTRHTNWRFRLRYDASLYQKNSFRNNNQFGVELRRNRRHSYTELSVLWMPNYYLRHLYWSRTASSQPRTTTAPRYVAADLSRVLFALEHEQRIARRLYCRITVSYAVKNYAAPFDERDNSTIGVDTRLRKRLSSAVEGFLGASVDFVSSSASDYSVVGIADISNSEIGVNGGVEIRLSRRNHLYWSEYVSYKHQSYSTADTADVYHYDRSDNEVVWRNRLTWRVHPHWQPRVYYVFHHSASNVRPGVSDVGAYSSNRFGLQMIHYF